MLKESWILISEFDFQINLYFDSPFSFCRWSYSLLCLFRDVSRHNSFLRKRDLEKIGISSCYEKLMINEWPCQGLATFASQIKQWFICFFQIKQGFVCFFPNDSKAIQSNNHLKVIDKSKIKNRLKFKTDPLSFTFCHFSPLSFNFCQSSISLGFN